MHLFERMKINIKIVDSENVLHLVRRYKDFKNCRLSE
jgi:hypothetical protein